MAAAATPGVAIQIRRARRPEIIETAVIRRARMASFLTSETVSGNPPS
jgi:hypothetical protein